jgi:hypothetical protein
VSAFSQKKNPKKNFQKKFPKKFPKITKYFPKKIPKIFSKKYFMPNLLGWFERRKEVHRQY